MTLKFKEIEDKYLREIFKELPLNLHFSYQHVANHV